MECFQELTDPRLKRARRHNLPDLIALTIDAELCGADNRLASILPAEPVGTADAGLRQKSGYVVSFLA